MSDTFLQTQLTQIESDITALNRAITALIADPLVKYKLDTGQSEQEVTYQSLERLKDMRSSLLNERDTLMGRLCVPPIINAPGW